MRRVLTSVRFKPEIHAGLRKLAENEGITISMVINRACERYLFEEQAKRKKRKIIFMIGDKKT